MKTVYSLLGIFILFLSMILMSNNSSPPITCTITISKASMKQVWNVLLDIQAYKEWNPSRRGSGVLSTVGQRIEWTLANGVADFAVVSKLSKLSEETKSLELEWTGGIDGALFLLNGRHWFLLSRDNNDGVFVEQGEELKGLLPRILFGIPYISSLAASLVRVDMERVNSALKERVISLHG